MVPPTSLQHAAAWYIRVHIPSPPAAVFQWCNQLLFNMLQRGSAGCKSLPTCSGVAMVPPTSLQHASAWQCRVLLPPHLQRCADGAPNFSSTCIGVADKGTSPSPPAAVFQWCKQILFNMLQHGSAGCKSLPTCAAVWPGATNFSLTCSSVAVQGATPSPPAAVFQWCHQLLFNMLQRGSAGCNSLSTCRGVLIVPRTSLQHAADEGTSPSPLAAVCQWGHHFPIFLLCVSLSADVRPLTINVRISLRQRADLSPVPEQPAPEQPVPEQPAPEQPALEQPGSEQPVSEKLYYPFSPGSVAGQDTAPPADVCSSKCHHLLLPPAAAALLPAAVALYPAAVALHPAAVALLSIAVTLIQQLWLFFLQLWPSFQQLWAFIQQLWSFIQLLWPFCHTGWPPPMLPGPSKGSQPFAPKTRGDIYWSKYKGPQPVLGIFKPCFGQICALYSLFTAILLPPIFHGKFCFFSVYFELFGRCQTHLEYRLSLCLGSIWLMFCAIPHMFHKKLSSA
jgi:hypothetical protein